MKSSSAVENMKGGFTLTELLAAIGIVVTLALLLLPAGSRLKDSALGTKCAGNLRNIATAMGSYASDNGGRYPTFGQDLSGPNNPPYWGEKLEVYLGRHSKTYICPAIRSKWAVPDENEKQPAALGFSYPGAWYAGISYGASPTIVSLTVSPDGTYPARTLGAIPRPSATVMLADSWDDSKQTEVGICWVVGHLNETSYVNPLGVGKSYVKYRHGKKANVCFADGHIETLSEEQLMPKKNLPKDDPDYSLWDFN